MRNKVIDLAVSEVSLFLACINQLFDIVKLIFKSQTVYPLMDVPW